MTTYYIDELESKVSKDSEANLFAQPKGETKPIPNKTADQTNTLVVTDEYNRRLIVVDHINQPFSKGIESTGSLAGPLFTVTPNRGGQTFISDPASSDYLLSDLLFYELTHPF